MNKVIDLHELDKCRSHGELVTLRQLDRERIQDLQNKIPKWQPIITAPRDGTYILLYRPSYDDRFKDSVREGKYHKYGMTGTWRVRSGGVWDIDAPTHWMPMPNPPYNKGE